MYMYFNLQQECLNCVFIDTDKYTFVSGNIQGF